MNQPDIKRTLFALAIVALCVGCAGVANILESKPVTNLIDIAAEAGAEVIVAATHTEITPQQDTALRMAADAAIAEPSKDLVWWFAEWLRSKQKTPDVMNTLSIASGGLPSNVAIAVPALVAAGVKDPNLANEAIAVTVSAVAASNLKK